MQIKGSVLPERDTGGTKADVGSPMFPHSLAVFLDTIGHGSAPIERRGGDAMGCPLAEVDAGLPVALVPSSEPSLG